jgi:hypothetical protein
MTSESTLRRLRVKVRRTQYEYMFSAFLSNSDIARCSRHVSNVPKAEVATIRQTLHLRQILVVARACLFSASYRANFARSETNIDHLG